MTALVFILILSFLVVIHELGHFFMARRYGVKVHEFGFGYPPKVFRLFRWKGTDFTFNWIPFGGFVKLDGEEFDPEKDEQKPKDPEAFYNKSAQARFAVIFAGPLVNILYALFVFSCVFSVMGIPTSLEGRARIGEVMPGSPAEKAGLTVDSEIVGFRLFSDEIATPKVEDVIHFTKMNQGKTVTIKLVGPCNQDACAEMLTEKEIYIRSEAEIPAGQGSMGIGFSDYYFAKAPWYLRPFQGMWYGLKEALQMGALIVMSLVTLFRDVFSGSGVMVELAGPVGIVHQASASNLLAQGWLTVFGFSGMLSLNLGIMNVLPIPALDGGRIFFIFLEKFIGKQRVQRFEGSANFVGFVLLLGLIITLSVRDVTRILQ